MIGTHVIKTDAIAATAAVKTSERLTGYIAGVVIDLRTAAGAASGNTATVALTDDLGRALFTQAGVTGVGNYYVPVQTMVLAANGATTDPDGYALHFLGSNEVTVTVSSGTNTEIVTVYLLLNHQS